MSVGTRAEVAASEPTRLQLALGGGARVEARQWSCDAPRASVLVLPALGIRASYYQTLAASLAARGLTVTTADLRGHGEHSVRVARGVSFGYAELVDDVLAIARQLNDQQPGPLFLLGHSLGGQLGLLASGAAPELFAGVVVVASGTPYHRGYPPRDARRIRLLARLIPLITGVVGYYPGERLGFGGRESAGLMRDWARLALEGRFSVQGRDAPAWLARIERPVLAVSLAGDSMAPVAALDQMLAMVPRAQVRREHLTAERCDPRALDHLRWARDPAAVVDLIDAWLEPHPL